MCQAASFIVTKDKVLWIPQKNGHTEILTAHKIEDKTDIPTFVKVEITPPIVNGRKDYRAPLKDWVYRVDQDVMPTWYVAKVDEKRAHKELPKWYASHIEGKITDADQVCFEAGYRSTLTAGYRSTLTAGDDSTLTAGDASTLTAGYRSTLTAGDGSTLTAGYDSTLTAGYDSTLTAGYRSTLTAGDGSTLTAGDGSTLTAGYRSTLTAGDDSTLTAGYDSTLTAGDGSTLTAGYRSVLIVRWYDGDKWQVAVKEIDKKEADKAFKFENGKFSEVKK